MCLCRMAQVSLADDTPRRSLRRGLSLFWRTFYLLALLLLGSIAVWLQTLRSFELEPRGEVEIKDKGTMQTWWLLGERPPSAALPPP